MPHLIVNSCFYFAVRQLHREFLRAGSDVLQTFTFYCSDNKLQIGGKVTNLTGQQINEAACDLAREVADEGGALVAAAISETPCYIDSTSESKVKEIFKKQLDVFLQKDIDFFIAEFFENVEEAEWAVHILKASGKPVAATLCISPMGDRNGVSPGDCAVRLVKAGAKIVGVNCFLDPVCGLKTVTLMKEGLEAAGLKAHLMLQPLGFHTPECNFGGYLTLPEFPFALESRAMNRWDMQKYAREAYNAGIRYIGGCCGFEPYHIRALSEELASERGFLPQASEKHGLWGSALDKHPRPWTRAKANREYWESLLPASGRPKCPSMATPHE